MLLGLYSKPWYTMITLLEEKAAEDDHIYNAPNAARAPRVTWYNSLSISLHVPGFGLLVISLPGHKQLDRNLRTSSSRLSSIPYARGSFGHHK